MKADGEVVGGGQPIPMLAGITQMAYSTKTSRWPATACVGAQAH